MPFNQKTSVAHRATSQPFPWAVNGQNNLSLELAGRELTIWLYCCVVPQALPKSWGGHAAPFPRNSLTAPALHHYDTLLFATVEPKSNLSMKQRHTNGTPTSGPWLSEERCVWCYSPIGHMLAVTGPAEASCYAQGQAAGHQTLPQGAFGGICEECKPNHPLFAWALP